MFKSLLLAAALATACAGYSQTNNTTLNTNGPVPVLSGPLTDVFAFLGKGSNWIVAPYGIIADSKAGSNGRDFGAGLALGYRLNDYVVPTLRIDWLRNQVWMPSADLQLQAPVTLFGKVTVVPFGFTGIATPISGQGAGNGSVVGLFGAGAALRLDFLGSGAFWKNTDLVADYELWTGGGFDNSKQVRFGLAYKF